MSIYLDDEPVAVDGDNLAAALVVARDQAKRDGRVVVEVQLDGQAVTAEQLDDADSTDIAGKEVRLYSAEPHELARNTLEQVRPQLDEVRRIQEQAAEHLQQDESKEAMSRIREMIETWLQTQQAVMQTSILLGIDLGDLHVDDTPFDQITAELLEKLQAVKGYLEAQDTVGLADTLLYEWPDLVEQWDRLIGELLSRVR